MLPRLLNLRAVKVSLLVSPWESANVCRPSAAWASAHYVSGEWLQQLQHHLLWALHRRSRVPDAQPIRVLHLEPFKLHAINFVILPNGGRLSPYALASMTKLAVVIIERPHDMDVWSALGQCLARMCSLSSLHIRWPRPAWLPVEPASFLPRVPFLPALSLLELDGLTVDLRYLLGMVRRHCRTLTSVHIRNWTDSRLSPSALWQGNPPRPVRWTDIFSSLRSRCPRLTTFCFEGTMTTAVGRRYLMLREADYRIYVTRWSSPTRWPVAVRKEPIEQWVLGQGPEPRLDYWDY